MEFSIPARFLHNSLEFVPRSDPVRGRRPIQDPNEVLRSASSCVFFFRLARWNGFWTLFFCRVMVGVGERPSPRRRSLSCRTTSSSASAGTTSTRWGSPSVRVAGLLAEAQPFGWLTAFSCRLSGMFSPAFFLLKRRHARAPSQPIQLHKFGLAPILTNKHYMLCIGYALLGSRQTISLWVVTFSSGCQI